MAVMVGVLGQPNMDRRVASPVLRRAEEKVGGLEDVCRSRKTKSQCEYEIVIGLHQAALYSDSQNDQQGCANWRLGGRQRPGTRTGQPDKGLQRR